MADEQVFVPGLGIVSRQEAEAIAKQGQQSGAPLFSSGSGGPNVELQLGSPDSNAKAMETFGQEASKAGPMIAGLANLHPALRGAGMSMAVPGIVEILRQKLMGEDFDPGEAATQSAMGVTAHAIGGLAKLPSHLGRSMVMKTVAQGEGPVAAERLTNTAVEHGASLTSKGIQALVKKSVELENQAHTLVQAGQTKAGNALKAKVSQLDELIERLRGTAPVSGGSNLPHVATSPTGRPRLGLPSLSPKTTLDLGQTLTTGEKTGPSIIEGLMRLLGADLSIEEDPTHAPR